MRLGALRSTVRSPAAVRALDRLIVQGESHLLRGEVSRGVGRLRLALRLAQGRGELGQAVRIREVLAMFGRDGSGRQIKQSRTVRASEP